MRKIHLMLVMAGALGMSVGALGALAQESPYADPAEPALPQTTMVTTLGNTALVITDPQIDFLSPDGVTWGVVGASVTENNTVANIGRLLDAAKSSGMTVAISPHYYYPTDHGWNFGGPLEKLMHAIGMFDRESPLSLNEFEGSGADFMPQYKKHIHDGKTIIASPHKVYGPEANDPCSCVSLASIKSFSPACPLTCACRHTCTNCWSRDSRWRWCAMPRRQQDCPKVTDTWLQSSTSAT
jgi:hypothetical protein